MTTNLSYAPSCVELSRTRFQWEASYVSDPNARRGSRRRPALFRDPSSGIRPPCRTSPCISRRRHRSPARPKLGSGPNKLRASPSSCSPAPTVRPWRDEAAKKGGLRCSPRALLCCSMSGYGSLVRKSTSPQPNRDCFILKPFPHRYVQAFRAVSNFFNTQPSYLRPCANNCAPLPFHASDIDCIDGCSRTFDGPGTDVGFAVLFQLLVIWRARRD